MKVLIFFFLAGILSVQISNAQSLFQWTIGGTGHDVANSIIRTADGGYAEAGMTLSFGAGNYDFYIIKLNASGTLQWSKTLGGTGDDRAYFIIQTTDGGYAVVGYTYSFGAGLNDMYIVKLDSSGTLQWTRTFGGTGNEASLSIIQTTDGGYAVAGRTNSFGAGNDDMYIVKLDASGTLQWSKTIGGTDYDYALSIIQTTDGGYAVAGWTSSFGAGNQDMYIVKLDGSGTLHWTRTVGGTGDDIARSIIQTTDGGYAVAGRTGSFPNYDMFIVKLDGSGTLQWTRTIGGTSEDNAYSIIQTTDGGYAVAGYANSFGSGGYDMYIVKLDASGTLQWSRTVGGTAIDYAFSIIQTTDGGLAAAGLTKSFGAGGDDMYVVKLDANGNTCGNSTSPATIVGNPSFTFNTYTPTVSLQTPTVTTPTPSTNSGGTLTIICTTVGIQPVSSEIPNQFSLSQNYPNPFNPSTVIRFQFPVSGLVTLKIYNALGREVATLINEQLNAGTYEVDFDGSNFASGVYYYKLITGDFIETKKMVLIK